MSWCELLTIPVYENVISRDDFIINIQLSRKPAVIRGVNTGDCCEKWTVEYLCDRIGDLEAKIHVSKERKLDFISKNFLYKTLSMKETIRRASSKNLEHYFIDSNEYYYLRSLSNERRGREVSDIKKLYPQIADDVKIPDFFNPEDFFSSVFRISSQGVQLWTHYDIMDNILIQVQGRKRVVLFDPSDVNFLYLEGDKSRVLDIDSPDLTLFPDFPKAKKYICELEPGDILFIPALWFHNTRALTYGVAVNVFWKNLDNNLYDKSDFYGNKDLIPAAKALQEVDKAINLIKSLPVEYRTFYLKRFITNIENNF